MDTMLHRRRRLRPVTILIQIHMQLQLLMLELVELLVSTTIIIIQCHLDTGVAVAWLNIISSSRTHSS